MRVEFGQRKHVFIKDNIPGYIDPSSFNIKTLKAFMKITIAKKSTLLGPKLKFPLVVRTQILPASTTKSPKR
jgi:hypothetical protein